MYDFSTLLEPLFLPTFFFSFSLLHVLENIRQWERNTYVATTTRRCCNYLNWILMTLCQRVNFWKLLSSEKCISGEAHCLLRIHFAGGEYKQQSTYICEINHDKSIGGVLGYEYLTRFLNRRYISFCCCAEMPGIVTLNGVWVWGGV